MKTKLIINDFDELKLNEQSELIGLISKLTSNFKIEEINDIIDLQQEARDYITMYKKKINKSPLESQGMRLAKLLLEL